MPDIDGNGFKFPVIEDSDIEWVEHLLGVEQFDEARRDFLKADQTLDVEACPGSGKTTLVVAKLAILARKWTYKDQGICVLSHTNVAREEIQERLGKDLVGQKLLSYPHFIGTIHSFSNQFLALPWLRSNGYQVVAIDDETCINKRQGLLGPDWGFRSYLERNYLGVHQIRILSKCFDICKKGGSLPFGPHTDSYKKLSNICKVAAEEGFFCFDEMFVWADALIEDAPTIIDALQIRFPITMIDEVQDTQEQQAQLLSKVFPRNNTRAIVQRVGDSNQAIYSSPTSGSKATTDPFPDTSRSLSISNSFRFGTEIGTLANPFAVLPVGESGLTGIGPTIWPSGFDFRHSIFLFDDDQIENILPAYGQLLLESFSDSQINHYKFKAAAIGGVKKESDEDVVPGHAHFPKSVCHYWQGFSPQMNKRDPIPRKMIDFVRVAQAKAIGTGESHDAVEKIAEGSIHLSSLMGNVSGLKNRRFRHRAILERIRGNREIEDAYIDVIRRLAVCREDVGEQAWEVLKEQIKEITQVICEADPEGQSVSDFLAWNSSPSLASTPQQSSAKAINTYVTSNGARSVEIELNSIHAVKGQTHTATLLLETFNRQHDFKHLFDWLIGNKSNGASCNATCEKRLRLMYVGMTRPTHLLCLAIRKSALDSGDGFDANVATLEGQGWNIKVINLDSR
jgi:superfamily I DNA/RNA helicase